MRGRKKQQSEENEVSTLPKGVEISHSESFEDSLARILENIQGKCILSRLEHINNHQVAIVINGDRIIVPEQPNENINVYSISYTVATMPQPVKKIHLIKEIIKDWDDGTTKIKHSIRFTFENGNEATAVFYSRS